VFLATATLAFFSIGELYRFFLGLLALAGLAKLIAERRSASEQWWLWYLAAFMCLWLPMAISTADAESVGKAASVSARYLIYLFAGYYWISRFVAVGRPQPLLTGAFAILLIWTADGLFQLIFGYDFFGNERFGEGRLTGMLPGVELGFTLAIFSPIFFHAVHTFGRRASFLWLTLIPFVVAILYGGSRVSWALLLISTILYAWFLAAMRVQLDLRVTATRLLLVLALSGVAILPTGWLQERIARISGLASDDYATVNSALSNRLPHWEAAVRMFRQNPVNGIGVKGYANAYPRYSAGDTTPRSQPHFYLLEVAAETGGIGLIGYLAFFVIVLARIRSLARQRLYEAIPWGIALLLAAFPLSASISLYAHFASALIWYIAMVFFGIASFQELAAKAEVPLAADRR
jgi:O-antigen ligase